MKTENQLHAPDAVPAFATASTGVATQASTFDSDVVAELRDARKHYGPIVALDGVDLQIRRGEMLAILGPNGAGKSTSVSLLLGLLEPDKGAATLFGQSPHSIDARRHIGVMLQDVTLTGELTARELIELSASYYASPMTIDEVLRATQLTAIAKRRYGKLSGGQKRQVQFAMAICGRPKLLFLDEPTAGLDIQAREGMWSTLRHLVGDGCSVVLTTHYLEEAEALADRVAVLAKGRLIAQGSVDEVRALVSRKSISCITTIHPDAIREWPGVTSVFVDERRTHIAVSDAESVARRLLVEDLALSELEIERAGLAEAFNELTQKVA
jgi:ABC-type multidrug transport system ATPase subunit